MSCSEPRVQSRCGDSLAVGYSEKAVVADSPPPSLLVCVLQVWEVESNETIFQPNACYMGTMLDNFKVLT